LKNILWGYAFPLSFGTIIGAQIGPQLVKKIKRKFLNRVIAFVAFIASLRLLISIL
jgi:uncharacterized membrane protein YfcA